MTEEIPPPGFTPTNFRRTTSGSHRRWVPPSPEHLQEMLPAYEITSILGRGGMGAVYRGRQKSLDRTVAIKILPPEAAGDEDAQFVERFKNEARTMAKMNHPGIVHVYDFGETAEGQLYIVMEFIDGTDVSKMIQSQGRLPEDYALSITAHVCDALQYAHTHGVVHRDIKPANVIINREGQVKVADFGLAKATDPSQMGLTKTNMAMGTPDFVSPEALMPGVPLDGRADLYAVGVMLYNMLAGTIPRGAFRMPGDTLKTDARFDRIIGKAMEMDRELRYQTALDLRRDLDVILTTPQARQQPSQKPVASAPGRRGPQNTEAPSPAKSSQPSAPAKKSKTPLIIGLGAAAALAVGAFFLHDGSSQPSDTPSQASPASPGQTLATSSQTPVKVREVSEATKPRPAPRPAQSERAAAPSLPTATGRPLPSAPSAAATPVLMPAVATEKKAPAAPPASALIPAGSRSLDLITLVDVRRDVVSDPTTGANVWKKENASLTFVDSEKAGRIAAPVSLAEARAFEIEVLWRRRAMTIPEATTHDSGYIALDVPVGEGRWVRVEVAKAGNKALAGGKRLGYHVSGTQGKDGMRVVVRCQDDTLSVIIDGSVIGSLSSPAGHAEAAFGVHSIFKSGLLPAVYCARGDHEIAGWTVRALDGEVRKLWEPATLQDPRLMQLAAGFKVRFEADVQRPHLTALAALNQSYAANGISRARAAAQAKGSLAEVSALDAETAAIEKGGAVPAQDAPDTPESLKSLRTTYRAALARLTAERDAKAAPLHEIYLTALDTYIAELTKAGKRQEAGQVRVLRESTLQSSKTAPPPP